MIMWQDHHRRSCDYLISVAEYFTMLSHFFCSYNKLIFCHEVNEIPCNVYFVV